MSIDTGLAVGFDAFQAAVSALWPTYKVDVHPMWDTTLHRFAISNIRDVLHKHRADYPDNTRPIWKLIYNDLFGSSTNTKSDLQVLLNQWRELLRKAKRKGSEHWGDYEVFQCFLHAQTFPILYNTITREPNEDPDGRLARRAAKERRSWAYPYIVDLRERGDVVPEWLLT
jgi:hypothetical protein